MKIAAWHADQASNGHSETMNGPAKRVAFGMASFVHWRIRVLLYYDGRPDRPKLATVTP